MHAVCFECREKDWAFLTEVDYKVGQNSLVERHK